MEEPLREIEFRDGKRWIPAYLADMMGGLKTHTMTYEQAIAKTNSKLASDHVERAFDRIVSNHFRSGGS